LKALPVLVDIHPHEWFCQLLPLFAAHLGLEDKIKLLLISVLLSFGIYGMFPDIHQQFE
jgi:hypothetical protein